MKIAITRDTLGRVLGVLLLTVGVFLLSYLATAWVWWSLLPYEWSMGARFTSLGFALFLLFLRWVAGAVTIREE